jgi:beta-glucosidase-like glycosyl hydrolase
VVCNVWPVGWGRNWEVATECPWLGGQIGRAYSQGFQVGRGEDGTKFLLGVITLKHWAAYTVEANRGGYNSVVQPFDLMDSYLPAFREAVVEGKAAGVMCSCQSPTADRSMLP